VYYIDYKQLRELKL